MELGWPLTLLSPCSIGSLVISAYAVCPDITATVTPDLKCPEGRGMGFSPLHCIMYSEAGSLFGVSIVSANPHPHLALGLWCFLGLVV